MAAVFDERIPVTISEKKEFLLRNHVALWDVVHSCEIIGSSDSSIKNVTPNDLRVILDVASIERVFVNGKTAEKHYKRYIEKTLGIKAFCLPSTSPANAAWNLDRLVDAWRITQEV